jgi:hypothetical protein
MTGRLVLVALLAFLPAGAVAQSVEESKAFYRQQFADWNGIVFRCLPDNKTDKLQTRLCERALQDARFLAAAAKIPFESVGTGADYASVAFAQLELGHALVLDATIAATQGEPRAVHMSLEATSFYSKATDLGASPDDPESKPRGGTLVLWNRMLLSAGGSDSELERAVSNGFETLLKDFFSLYLESRQ